MPVPGYSRAAVQALEDDEDAVGVLGLDADAVVAHREQPVAAARARRATWTRGRLVAAELDGVADQVLEELAQLRRRRPRRSAAGRG